jgi:putative acetyltransferase
VNVPAPTERPALDPRPGPSRRRAVRDVPDGLRRVTDADAEGLIDLVGAAYDEHPGCVLDLPGIDDDLPIPGTTAARRGSPWWVLERAPAEGDGPPRIVASIGCGRVEPDGAVELKRLYVASTLRGRGLATRLIGLVERHAAGLGARCVELWSDTRFHDAHRRYAALGYERTGEDRLLHDPSDTTEWRFVKRITPASPDRRVTWSGPYGTDRATLTTLPDGWRLRASIEDAALGTASRDDGTAEGAPSVPDRAGHLEVEVEVDAAWRARRTDVTHGGVRRTVTSDGEGSWWRDGEPAADLRGAIDVVVDATPLTDTLPIRRLLAAGTAADEAVPVSAVRLRVPGSGVEVVHRTFTATGPGRWRVRGPEGAIVELTVDDDGLVDGHGARWRRSQPG